MQVLDIMGDTYYSNHQLLSKMWHVGLEKEILI